MNREELIAKLRRIDETIYFSSLKNEGDEIQKASLVIVGGSALLLQNLLQKPTTKDVDILSVESRIVENILDDPDFNLGCQAYSLCIPYCFDKRLIEIPLKLKTFKVFTLSLEDLAVMKLYRWEDSDKRDLTSAAFLEQLDCNLLDRLINDPNEAAASRIAVPENDREFKNLLFNYAEYKKGWLE